MKPKQEHTPTIIYTRPRCQFCSSTRLKIDRSMKHDTYTDAVRQYARCKNCGRRQTMIAQ